MRRGGVGKYVVEVGMFVTGDAMVRDMVVRGVLWPGS